MPTIRALVATYQYAYTSDFEMARHVRLIFSVCVCFADDTMADVSILKHSRQLAMIITSAQFRQ